MTTFSGLTPISSAAICARTVRIPSPISVTPVAILTVPPSSISAQVPARSTAAVRAMPYQPPAIPLPRFIVMSGRTPMRQGFGHAGCIDRFSGHQRARTPCSLAAEVRSRRTAYARYTIFPPRRFARGFEHLIHAGRIENVFGVSSVTLSHYVFQAQFERVHSQPLGTNIEMGFGCKLRLQRSERPECARWRVVCVDPEGIDLEILDVIGSASEDRTFANDALGRHPISAAIVNNADLRRQNDPVLCQTHLLAGPRRVAFRRGRNRLFAREDKPDGASCLDCEKRKHALINHILLAAKTAADRTHDHADLVDRQVQNARQHM